MAVSFSNLSLFLALGMAQRLAFMVVIFMSLVLQAPAQEITFCLDHTDNGLPLGSGKQFELERFGQDVELLFRNRELVRTEKLYFFIDYQQEGKYAEFDTKTMAVDHNKNWALLSYRFQQTGRYRVLVLDAEKKEICRGEVDIIVKEEENSPEYFNGARIVFCNTAIKGQPDTLIKALKVPVGQAKTLSIFIRHIRPFKTHHIFVDIWAGSGEGAGQYLETVEFTLDPNWTYSQFPYEFRSSGVYTFRVYNEDEIWITSAALEVTME
jgi:hypothetical protein